MSRGRDGFEMQLRLLQVGNYPGGCVLYTVWGGGGRYRVVLGGMGFCGGEGMRVGTTIRPATPPADVSPHPLLRVTNRTPRGPRSRQPRSQQQRSERGQGRSQTRRQHLRSIARDAGRL